MVKADGSSCNDLDRRALEQRLIAYGTGAAYDRIGIFHDICSRLTAGEVHYLGIRFKHSFQERYLIVTNNLHI